MLFFRERLLNNYLNNYSRNYLLNYIYQLSYDEDIFISTMGDEQPLTSLVRVPQGGIMFKIPKRAKTDKRLNDSHVS